MSDSAVLRLQVVGILDETNDARSIVLASPSGQGPVGYRPGQFLTFRVPGSGGSGSLARCYSLSSSPHDEDSEGLVVTAKRIAGGRGSTWLCDELHVGDMVEVLRPAGVFTPDDLGRDLLLVAAGSGITPVISIAESALRAGGGKVTLLYANRDDRSVIFAERLADLVRRYPDRLTVIHWLESLEGIPEPVTLGARLAPFADREVFVCGPAPFMDVVSQACASIGVPGSDIHIEEFVSLAGDPFEIGQPLDGLDLEDAAEVEVELDGQTTTVAWPRARVLLDALLAAGIDAPFSCREGACSACACVVTVGEVEMATNDILQEEDVREGVILSCQARPLTDKVRVTYDL